MKFLIVNTLEELEQIPKENIIIIYLFGSKNCAPCKNLKRELFELDSNIENEMIKKKYKIPIVLFDCNIHDYSELKIKFGIKSIPSCYVISIENYIESLDVLPISKNSETLESFMKKFDNIINK